MDRIAACTLKKICAAAPLGKYVILSEDEFLESFPENEPPRGDELIKALKNLKSDGYIDVKYSGGNMFCVAPLKIPEAERVEATAEIPVYVSGESKAGGKTALTFFAAFAGGALGSFIICLAFALV